ncbi:hypothetical protein [Singulisphaera acidiphila]|uniref:Cytochrome c domain-containing protein n=1 Tax=Singulisphaera acidiphila (strain ATCC BAA-1392 / DSM 18658 / VKM B-2454 / MOB10) TaxID=886293 RepID=L0DAA0_SINAD|nr:hypothetical protein [Singulisphaera acidiphila]AGA26304.1 hypothetical protein Sinac_1943 [Singulisphaera acidiphila DSM 18658]
MPADHHEHQRSVVVPWGRSVLLVFALLSTLAFRQSTRGAEPLGVNNPLHGYDTLPTEDRFARLKADLDTGRASLEGDDELALLRNLLRALDIPVSSQMLVTSATSFQKTIISPRRPRALYFNDDTYVGFVPGGQLEVISIDPARGAMFYIFGRPEAGKVPRIRRTENCLTCHATPEMDEIPQLVIESVVPGITGGGEKAFRRGLSGHGVPFDQRFGGWLVTDAPDFKQHWGNILIEWTSKGAKERSMEPGELFDLSRYPVPTSNLLPQLLHEHQVGFVNRAVSATYRTRTLLHEHAGRSEPVKSELESLARGLVRYLLFADEVPLPPGGVPGAEPFKADFLAKRRVGSNGRSLRDLELSTRLMRYRCSYMIDSPAFAGLPQPLSHLVDLELERALDPSTIAHDYTYLPAEEKQVIRTLLQELRPSARPDDLR